MVKSMPYIDHSNEVYKSCILNKHLRASFKSIRVSVFGIAVAVVVVI